MKTPTIRCGKVFVVHHASTREIALWECNRQVVAIFKFKGSDLLKMYACDLPEHQETHSEPYNSEKSGK